jgi:hypothetical protein
MLPPWTWLVASNNRKTGKGDESRHERTTLDCIWIAQILLAGIFLFPGGSKLLAYERVMGVVSPPCLLPGHLLIRLATGGWR